MLCMETVAKIRRMHYKEGLSQRAIAEKLQLNRRTVSKYLTALEPPKYTARLPRFPKLGAFIPALEQRLNYDGSLTAMQHFEWLKSEGYEGQYCAVTAFIRSYKKQHNIVETPVFIPQRFTAAEAYQFDWSTETVKLAGSLTKVSVAHFRLCHSRAFFIQAYFNQRMEMLIDAHNRAFAFFGGVPRRGIYDNMKTAVISIGVGKERTFNKQFLMMMNHFLIEPVACTPASGWEKGQVERQVGVLRQKLFKPLLAFDTLQALNGYLEERCRVLMQQMQHPQDKSKSIAQYLLEEKLALMPYHPYTGYRSEMTRVSSLSLVSVDGHKYSVPCHLAGHSVLLQVTATEIKVIAENDCVATHARSFDKGQTSYNPWHYLDALKRKPGALRNGEPFTQWELPKPVKTLQQHLLKHPKGDRAVVQLLTLIAEYGEDVGITAAALALEEGMPTVEAVLNIIHRLTEPVIPRFSMKDIPLNIPPEGNCARYNSLLKELCHAKA